MPRCFVSPNEPSPINQLHCFCDASQLAYGAVIYIRSHSADNISTGFVIARAKVAPLKQISIPKLELQAAVLGCRLMQFVSQQLTKPVTSRHIWSDSEAVLAWIKSKVIENFYCKQSTRDPQQHRRLQVAAYQRKSQPCRPCLPRNISL